MIRVIVLDFDGTLVESVDVKTDAFRELFRDYEKVRDQILAYHLEHNGVSRLIKLRHIYEHFLKLPYDEKTEQQVTERFSALVFERVVQCSFVPGAPEFLNYFAHRCPLYVVSSSPRDELERVISARGMMHWFRGVFGAPQSKAEAIRHLLAQEDASPEEAVFVGDSVEDYQAGLEVGVRFVARQNKESFAHANVPVFPDMETIHHYLAREFSGAFNTTGQSS